MILCGDIHGEFAALKRILSSTEEDVIVLGDLGIGFPGIGDNPLFRKNMKFIRGNHDKPSACKNHSQYLGDYGYLPEKRMMYISGAISVDSYCRTPGVDWWDDEHLSYSDLQKAIDLYAKVKPDIVISHDCPWEITENICNAVVAANPYLIKYGPPKMYSTNIAFDTMLSVHRPSRWYFGHWHIKYEKEVKGTKYRCLDIFETTIV